jgi:hypothetical protein
VTNRYYIFFSDDAHEISRMVFLISFKWVFLSSTSRNYCGELRVLNRLRRVLMKSTVSLKQIFGKEGEQKTLNMTIKTSLGEFPVEHLYKKVRGTLCNIGDLPTLAGFLLLSPLIPSH